MMTTPTVHSLEQSLDLHEVLDKRRSPKAFLPRAVEPEKLRQLLEAARWSPSSRNEQPWRFIVGIKEQADGYERLLKSLTDANQQWAQQAPVLIAVVAKLIFERDGKPNGSALLDVGGAIANLTVQAIALGLQVHQMAGFDRQKLKEACAIPDGFEPAVVLAVGYADDAQVLPQDRRKRLPLHALAFEGTWGRLLHLISDGGHDASFHD